jgi:hypothetical protein
MLRDFTAALIATALIAGPALAAQPSSNAGAAPAAASATPADIKGQVVPKATDARKPVKTIAHARSQARTHVRHHVAHVVRPGKTANTPKSSA